MPEILEVELYRRAAVGVLGRRIRAVRDDDSLVVSPVGGFQGLVGTEVTEVHRHGKVLSLTCSRRDSDAEEYCIDLHFGMT